MVKTSDCFYYIIILQCGGNDKTVPSRESYNTNNYGIVRLPGSVQSGQFANCTAQSANFPETCLHVGSLQIMPANFITKRNINNGTRESYNTIIYCTTQWTEPSCRFRWKMLRKSKICMRSASGAFSSWVHIIFPFCRMETKLCMINQ